MHARTSLLSLLPLKSGLIFALGMSTLLVACNSSTGTQTQAGGAPGASGGSGGSSATGGALASGGATGGGGGNSMSTGGSATGGSSKGGSDAAVGGSGGSITGGATGSGGATGGAKGTGGDMTAGGSGGGAQDARADGAADARVGGAIGSGGTTTGAGGKTTATGGATSATGGTTATGGATQTGSCAPPTTGHYQMENLDRGVVAVKVTSGVYVGWRMMGYEYNPTSPTSVAYNVYRSGTKLATVTDSTNYLDSAGTTSSSYTVSAVINGTECAQSPSVKTWSQNYLSIPLDVPATSSSGATYSANDGSTGDLDGDGILDIVLKWDPSDAQDNSNSGVTSNVFLDGYTLAGKHLWRIDLGPNIRAGAHYTQFSVYDFDGDGKAEVACKTAPGTKDGTGKYLSTGPAATDDDSQVYRNSNGYILTGPEYLTVFEGATGKELATVAYPVLRGTVTAWGDDYGNRVDRFNGGAAFVSDTGSGQTASGRPSIIAQRGYYTRATVSAYNWRGGALTKVWTYDGGDGGGGANGQGAHSAMVADTDNDGAQEIVIGAATIDSNGAFKCRTGFGHGDALHVGELIPGKGITVFMPHEDKTQPTYSVADANTCAVIVKGPVTGSDNGRGVADDIDPSNSGAEFWSAADSTLYSATDGSNVGAKPSAQNFLIYWDADESRELEDGTKITKFGGSTLLSASGCASNNGTKSTPTLTADLLGDWREELVLRESDSSALRVYTTTDVTKRRIYTLMHDPTYRMQVSFEQSSYNQPPHAGFHIGNGMADPPKPDIYVK